MSKIIGVIAGTVVRHSRPISMTAVRPAARSTLFSNADRGDDRPLASRCVIAAPPVAFRNIDHP
jgi:hypothetical protein